MRLLNRTGVSLLPTEALWQWLESTQGASCSRDLRQSSEGSLYLLPEYEDDAEYQQALSDQADRILSNELDGFEVDPSLWPSPLDRVLLERFFELQVQVVCFDLCDRDLLVADIPEVL